MADPLQSYTLLKEKSDLGEKGTPPYSIWRSKESERPSTSYHCSRKEILVDWEWTFRGKGNANFLRLHVGSFQENSQVAKVCWIAVRDVELNRFGFVLNATTYNSLLIHFQKHRYIYTWRKINSREVGHPNGVFSANWDGSGCGGSGVGAVWMVRMVATVAPPPTPPRPAWPLCWRYATVGVLWVAHFRAQLKKRPASHPNTLHLWGHNLTFEPLMSIVTAPTTRTNSESSSRFLGKPIRVSVKRFDSFKSLSQKGRKNSANHLRLSSTGVFFEKKTKPEKNPGTFRCDRGFSHLRWIFQKVQLQDGRSAPTIQPKGLEDKRNFLTHLEAAKMGWLEDLQKFPLFGMAQRNLVRHLVLS